MSVLTFQHQVIAMVKIGIRPQATSHEAVVAEWLRRLTRNQIPSGSVGSSPTDRAFGAGPGSLCVNLQQDRT